MKAKKPTKPAAWSHKATPTAQVAIRELVKVKAKQAILTKKSKLLQDIILGEGGGEAFGVRAAIRTQSAFSGMRFVTRKARKFVVLLDAKTGSKS